MIEIEIEIEIEIDRADSHVIDRSINDIDAKDRLKIVVEIRDNIEVIHTSEYHSFLQYLMPIFIHLLEKLTTPHFGDGTIALSHIYTPASFDQLMTLLGDIGPEHKLRNIILEIFNRIPHTEQLSEWVPQLLKLAMRQLQLENEENAIICLRIIIDLHKNFRYVDSQ